MGGRHPRRVARRPRRGPRRGAPGERPVLAGQGGDGEPRRRPAVPSGLVELGPGRRALHPDLAPLERRPRRGVPVRRVSPGSSRSGCSRCWPTSRSPWPWRGGSGRAHCPPWPGCSSPSSPPWPCSRLEPRSPRRPCSWAGSSSRTAGDGASAAHPPRSTPSSSRSPAFAVAALGSWLHLSWLLLAPASALAWSVLWWTTPTVVGSRRGLLSAASLVGAVGGVLAGPYGLSAWELSRRVQEACEGVVLEWAGMFTPSLAARWAPAGLLAIAGFAMALRWVVRSWRHRLDRPEGGPGARPRRGRAPRGPGRRAGHPLHRGRPAAPLAGGGTRGHRSRKPGRHADGRRPPHRAVPQPSGAPVGGCPAVAGRAHRGSGAPRPGCSTRRVAARPAHGSAGGRRRPPSPLPAVLRPVIGGCGPAPPARRHGVDRRPGRLLGPLPQCRRRRPPDRRQPGLTCRRGATCVVLASSAGLDTHALAAALDASPDWSRLATRGPVVAWSRAR